MALILTLFCILLILSVFLQVRLYAKLKRQAKLMALQQEQQESQKKITQAIFEEKEHLIDLVSHDLKGPFNRIYALIQLLSMSSGNLTHEQLDYIGKIHQISSDGLGMLRNLLDNRRLEDKGLDLTVERLNFSRLVSGLVKNYVALAEKKRVTIFFENQAEVFLVSDKLTLSRTVENLLSNALKFSPQEKRIWVTLSVNDIVCELRIRDEGPGISVEDQAKLFQKYQRLSARPTAGESSTGLGLYLVKSMVEKIGGRVAYYGGLGKGSEFIVRLPVESAII